MREKYGENPHTHENYHIASHLFTNNRGDNAKIPCGALFYPLVGILAGNLQSVTCSFRCCIESKVFCHDKNFEFTPEQLLHRDRPLVSRQPYDLVRRTLDVSQPITLYAGLCRRRRWPEPLYESFGCPTGYTCVVRVNNREYQTDGVCDTDTLARESAAMRAYLICRNFSVNDGMYPAGHAHGGIVQGIPVAIGTGRRSRYADDTDTSTSGGSRSGGSSPESYDGGRVGRDRPARVPTRALAYGHRGLQS